jgi:hypothetical protein
MGRRGGFVVSSDGLTDSENIPLRRDGWRHAGESSPSSLSRLVAKVRFAAEPGAQIVGSKLDRCFDGSSTTLTGKEGYEDPTQEAPNGAG